MKNRLAAAILIVFIATNASPGQTPLGTEFTYQGRLANAGSAANGLHDLRFRLYDASTVGLTVGSVVCIDNLNVTEGLFTVSLDFGAQFAGQERYLAIEVRADTGLDCANPTDFVILTPRQALTAAPNALYASNADLIDGLNSSAFLQSIPVPLTLSGTNSFHIIRGENASTSVSAGVFGMSTAAIGTTHGVQGVSSSTSGIGVAGNATASVGSTIGVLGDSDSPSGTGVFGNGGLHGGMFETNSAVGSAVLASAPVGGFGVFASSHNVLGTGILGSGATGVIGQSPSTSGIGILGQASANSGTTYGGRFENASAAGTGVFGYAASATGNTHGGKFQCDSPDGRAVAGFATSTTGFAFGGEFTSASPGGVAAYGLATSFSGANYGGYFRTFSAAGLGGFCGNNALGESFDVELSGPKGAINTPGFVYREYTASSPKAAIPVAYGSISASGAISGGTGNFTVSHAVTGEYDITISGETYSNSTFAVSVTPLHNTIPVCGTAADVGTPLRINIWRLDTAVKADIAFQFVVYAANPSEPG